MALSLQHQWIIKCTLKLINASNVYVRSLAQDLPNHKLSFEGVANLMSNNNIRIYSATAQDKGAIP